jgi:hypothetical protein
MRTNTIYAIYWMPSGSTCDTVSCSTYEAGINQYFTDVAAASGSLSNVYSVAMQYYDNVAAVHYQSTFAGSYVDTTSPFPNDCNDGTDAVCNTDAAIQTEIQHVLTVKGWHASTTTMFFVMTPDGIGSCFDSSDTQCTTNLYCAYHSGFDDTSNEPVIYGNEPFNGTISGCFGNTGQNTPNNADVDPEVNTISHEQNEAITDPWGDAWLDSGGNEIGDICAWQFGPNQSINGHSYSLQKEYSNDGNACLQSYTPSVAPTNFTAPVLSGLAAQSKLLSTTEGSWLHAPSGYAYKWQRCASNGTGCADIPGATAATYQLAAADAGHSVRAEVSAHNAAGTSAFVASALTAGVVPLPTAAAAPAVSGVAAVHKQLSTTNGAWNTAVNLAYAWLRCAADGSGCGAIPGATSSIYILTAADAGHTLEARVSATNAAGTTPAVSNRTAVVIAAPTATKGPRISGHARVGKKLTASNGTWTGPPTAYRYQWLRCNAHGGSCRKIAHATHSTYRLTRHDLGHRLRAQITATDAAGSGTATSAATARVPSAHKR